MADLRPPLATMRRRFYAVTAILCAAGCGSFAAGPPEEPSSAADAGEADARVGATDDAQSEDAASEAAHVDAGIDAEAEIDGAAWSSPNGAKWQVTAGATRITGVGAYNHPVLVWVASAKTAMDDYTVTATITSPPAGASPREFGLFARGTAGGSGVVLGSEYGGATKPFLAPMGPPDWNPVSNLFGAAYAAKPSTAYNMKLRVMGTTVSGKIWEAALAEPGTFQVMGAGPATGKLAGFYTYSANGAVLTSFSISSP